MEESQKAKQAPGAIQILYKVVTSPGEAFAAVAEAPRPLIPVLMLVAVNLIVALVMLPKVKEFTRITLEELHAPPEQIAISLKAVAVSTAATAIVVPLLIWLMEAAVLKLIDQFTVRGTPFKTLFSVAVVAWVPAAIGNLVKMLLSLFAQAKDLMLIQTSLAVLLPRGQTSGALFAVLSKVDLFVVWNLILLAIGAGITLKNRNQACGGVHLYLVGAVPGFDSDFGAGVWSKAAAERVKPDLGKKATLLPRGHIARVVFGKRRGRRFFCHRFLSTNVTRSSSVSL